MTHGLVRQAPDDHARRITLRLRDHATASTDRRAPMAYRPWMRTLPILLALLLPLAACTRDATTPTAGTPAKTASAPSAAAIRPVTPDAIVPWTLPVDAAAQPDLVALPGGDLLLSWIEATDAGHALRFARHGARGWSAPATVASGDDWFVNWADTPHIAATADGALWAHWLRKSAAATYAYDVVLSRSADAGASWSAPVVVNTDGTPTEHGFVSVWPAARDRLGIAWLDGRHTGGGHGGHGGHGGGMMTLRAASFDAALARHDEAEVDASTCDCCQTDIAMTARGPLLVYRDRTAQEIRDIATTRWQDGAWTAPRLVHADHWTMPACPVNGPAAVARGNDVRVAWYTAAQGGIPEVRFARSADAGDRFAAPLSLDRGEAVLGRVGVALDPAGGAWVSWLREDAQGQSLWLARVDGEPARIVQKLLVATLQGRGRGTGLPQLVASGDALHVVWTDLVGGAPRLQGRRIALR